MPDDTPWWAWVLVSTLVAFVYPMYKVWSGTRKQSVRQQETDVRLSRVDYQTSNDHGTNMRDDIDRAVRAAERAAEASENAQRIAQETREHQRHIQRDIGGLREDQRILARRLDTSTTLDREERATIMKQVLLNADRIKQIERGPERP